MSDVLAFGWPIQVAFGVSTALTGLYVTLLYLREAEKEVGPPFMPSLAFEPGLMVGLENGGGDDE